MRNFRDSEGHYILTKETKIGRYTHEPNPKKKSDNLANPATERTSSKLLGASQSVTHAVHNNFYSCIKIFLKMAINP